MPAALHAQAPDTLSPGARISVLTILPGDALYSAWGHTAFRVRDPAQNLDRVFDYGTFQFDDPFFIPKFVYGKLDYLLSAGSFERRLSYAANVEHRPVIEQELNLDAGQRVAVYRYLLTNYAPENRTYRYDFLFDNCSTRPRDVLEQTLGDALSYAPVTDPPETFRHLIDPYVADRPFLDLGFDLLLGTPTDRIATPRERMFLPLNLLAGLDGATLMREGAALPLVVRKDTLTWPRRWAPVQPALPWTTLLFGGVLLFGVGRMIQTRRRPPTIPGRADVWLLFLVGFAGVFMLFMWFGTEHVVTRGNWNVLWALPTHLPAALLLGRPHTRPWLRWYFYAAAGLALLVPVGWLFAWPMAFHPAVVPLALFLGLRCLWLARALKPAVPAST